MSDYKLECMEYAKVLEIPPETDGSNFLKGIALVERNSGVKNYVIVKQVLSEVVVVKDFSVDGIKAILRIYPYEFRAKTKAQRNMDVSKLKVKSDYMAWLKAAGVGVEQHKDKKLEELKQMVESMV